jgi:hypothetical protein
MLPLLSSRVEEDKRPAKESKEFVVSSRLEPFLRSMCLHLHPKHEELLTQMRGFPDGYPFVDLVDALAQGPPVWQAPMASERSLEIMQRNQLARRITAKYTGYWNPYGDKNDRKPERDRWPDAPAGSLRDEGKPSHFRSVN